MDETTKRRNLAAKSIIAATQLVDTLNILVELQSERIKLAQSFVPEDFTLGNLIHLDVGTLGQLFDFVIPSFMTTYTDVANGGRNQQVLLQFRQ